jgi:hypothetical protein
VAEFIACKIGMQIPYSAYPEIVEKEMTGDVPERYCRIAPGFVLPKWDRHAGRGFTAGP